MSGFRRVATAFDKKFVFEEVHSKEIQQLQQETPGFIARDLRPPNSPDLNPVDYHIWSLMQERVLTQLTSGIALLRLGRAFPRVLSTKPWTSGDYDYEPASKQRDDTSSTRCNQPAVFSATHILSKKSYALVWLNISNILLTH